MTLPYVAKLTVTVSVALLLGKTQFYNSSPVNSKEVFLGANKSRDSGKLALTAHHMDRYWGQPRVPTRQEKVQFKLDNK